MPARLSFMKVISRGVIQPKRPAFVVEVAHDYDLPIDIGRSKSDDEVRVRPEKKVVP